MNMANNSTKNNSTTSKILGRYHYGYHSILLFLALLIILHNSLVPFLYFKMKSLRKSTNFLLVNLSIADLFTGLLFIPLLVSSAALSSRGQGYMPLYFTANFVSDFITLAIIFSLLLVSLERYTALCHPYDHPRIVTTKTTRFTVITIWLFSLTVAIIPLSWSYPALNGQKSDVTNSYTYYSLTILIGCFFFPSIVMIFCLVSMFNVIIRFVRQDTSRGLNIKSGRRSQKKAVFIFLAMFLNMFVCWSPLVIIRLIMDTRKTFSPSKELLEILVALRCCSSLLNPVIYVWCKTDFKTAFFKLLFTWCHIEQENFSIELQVMENGRGAQTSLL